MTKPPAKPIHIDASSPGSWRGKGSVIPSRAEMNRLHAMRDNLQVDGGYVEPSPEGVIIYPSRPLVLKISGFYTPGTGTGPYRVDVYANGLYNGSGAAQDPTAQYQTGYTFRADGRPVADDDTLDQGTIVMGWRVGDHYEFAFPSFRDQVIGTITAAGLHQNYIVAAVTGLGNVTAALPYELRQIPGLAPAAGFMGAEEFVHPASQVQYEWYIYPDDWTAAYDVGAGVYPLHYARQVVENGASYSYVRTEILRPEAIVSAPRLLYRLPEPITVYADTTYGADGQTTFYEREPDTIECNWIDLNLDARRWETMAEADKLVPA